MTENAEKILKILSEKSVLKQKVFTNTLSVFNLLKDVLREMETEFVPKTHIPEKGKSFVFKERGDYQAELKVAGDMMIFGMHTNVFEFDRDHGVWKTSYVQSNKMSTYSGIINIYNFLADSFRFGRKEDLGYLVARIFINKDMRFFVEGKRQMGYYTDFGNTVLDKKILRDIIESSILYALDFDLLVPPYDRMKIASVAQIKEKRKKTHQQTGKRLGFNFNSDDVQGEKAKYSGK